MSELWMIDARASEDVEGDFETGTFAFCPVEMEKGEVKGIQIGLTLVSDRPPGEFVGVFHDDGQEACNAFCERHNDTLKALKEATRP